MGQVKVVALYKFFSFPDYKEVQPRLKVLCAKENIKGTLLVAEEGINGTVAGPESGIDALLDYLTSDSRLADLEYKFSYSDFNPFYRLKIRLKKEIVTLGVEGVDPNKMVGTYVEGDDWNALLEDPEVTVIDTRNDYEYRVGSFKNALNPDTDTFREFPDYVEKNLDPKKHKKVAMFCTGGIRCEKASSYMLEKGFEEVYHLKGGILKYLEDDKKNNNLWEGECFVFDNRVTVDKHLNEGTFDQCHGCRMPITAKDKQSKHYIKGVSCPHCYNERTDSQKQRAQERQKQIDLAKKRNHKSHGSITF